MRDTINEDPVGSQRLINMINQMILLLRNNPQPAI